MDRASAIGISLLLLISIFAPFNVMAQETADPEQPEPIMLTGFCPIGNLEVVDLDYQQTTAIQGIVMQDIASSAEEYNKQAALEELGIDTQTDRAKLADKYNFYFMGPDGTVFYYEVLDDLMKRDNGYLIGTEITGRIEYGGHLRENLAMCGKSPSNVTSNLCINTGNLDKVTEYVNEMKKAKSTADLMGWVSSLSPVDSLAPEDFINLGQSRLRMTEFTTSMATGGPGSSIFVLPQALVMYTAAMKKLDMIDLALAIVAMGSILKGHESVAKELGVERKAFWSDLFGKNKKSMKALLKDDNAYNIAKRADLRAAEIRKMVDSSDEAVSKLALAKTADEIEDARKAVNLQSKRLAEAIEHYQKGLKYADNLDGVSDIRVALSKAEYDDILKGLRSSDGAVQSQAINTARKFGKESQKIGYIEIPDELAGKIMGLDGIPLKKGDTINTKYLVGDTSRYRFAEDIPMYPGIKPGETLAGKSFTIADASILGVATETKDLLPAAELTRLSRSTRSPIEGLFAPIKQMFNQPAIFKATDISKMVPEGSSAILGIGGTLQLAAGTAGGAVLFRAVQSFGKAIYFGPGTKVLFLARGLHSINDLFFRQGFFELTGSGLTLRYQKDDIGTIYADDSAIVLLAENSQVDGLMSAYLGGELGALFFGLLGGVSKNIQPLISKANTLGDVLVFGGIMYPPSTGIIDVVEENPTGTTHIEQKGDHYIIHMREWDDHVFSAVEDVRTMEQKGGGGSLVTAMGLWTTKIDLYGHMFSENPDDLKGVFTSLDQITKQMGSWGVFSNLLIASSAYYMFFSPVAATVGGMAFGVAGLPLGMSVMGKGALLAGQEFQTAKYTSMKDLGECVRGEVKTNETAKTESFLEGAGSEVAAEAASFFEAQFNCERVTCAEALNDCFAKEGLSSAVMGVSAVSQYALPAIGQIALMPVDIAASIYKMKIREECLATLSTCQEHTFTILGAAQYTDPAIIAEEQQTEQLKALPGLDALPINEFLAASGMDNITNPLDVFSQQQLNVHTEGYNSSGRIAFDEIYYTHLQDVSIQWLEGNLPINLCSLDDEGNPDEANCLKIHGDTIAMGGKSIVVDELVPFKWMDTELPALIIPNTAVAVQLPGSGCNIFTVDKTGTRLTLNPSISSKFESEGFDEVERMLGTMRVINTDGGAIYPSVDYNGDFRLEHDRPDGSFGYSEEDVSVNANGEVLFAGDTLGFESAVFTGGSIIKKGDKIYVLPKYFLPTMSGREWLQETRGTPFRSDTGEQLEIMDAEGNVLGLDASLTRIPGREKLGILTRLDAEKDLNGNGKIEDDERSGWRFYTDENNETKFDLWYNGVKETYDSNQVEIDEETGAIQVYEKDQPHVEANLLRILETKVDSLGRTLLTISDGKGNILLEEALITYLKGTGGAIRYDPDNNNYIFVNGQPVELNNDFKLNGFNPITGRTDPPLLQPSAIRADITPYEAENIAPPAVPLRGDGLESLMYILALFVGIFFIYRKT